MVEAAGVEHRDAFVDPGADPRHVDFDTPDSPPRAWRRSETFRVLVPVVQAVMTTPHRALSTRRRGSSSDGKSRRYCLGRRDRLLRAR